MSYACWNVLQGLVESPRTQLVSLPVVEIEMFAEPDGGGTGVEHALVLTVTAAAADLFANVSYASTESVYAVPQESELKVYEVCVVVPTLTPFTSSPYQAVP